jgi:hypothetical protein
MLRGAIPAWRMTAGLEFRRTRHWALVLAEAAQTLARFVGYAASRWSFSEWRRSIRSHALA